MTTDQVYHLNPVPVSLRNPLNELEKLKSEISPLWDKKKAYSVLF